MDTIFTVYFCSTMLDTISLCIAAHAMTQRLTVDAWVELVSSMCVQCFKEQKLGILKDF